MSARRTSISRRTFLKYSAATCAATYLGWNRGTAQAVEPADLVLRNGNIITVDATDSIAQAVAVQGDTIMAVGTNDAIAAFIGPQTEVIELAGKTVTPGIVDSHLHAMYYGRQFWEGFVDIRFPRVKTLSDLLDLVEYSAQTRPAGQWVSGNQGFYITQGPADFDKTQLDAVAPNHPVYLRHGSGQYSVVNSQALTVSGIDVGGITDNPFGGVIVRDPVTQEPTGILLHYPAENLVMLHADGHKDLSTQALESDVQRAHDRLLAAGITSAQDVIVGEPAHLAVYRGLGQRQELRQRTYTLLYVNTELQAHQYANALQGYKTKYATFGGWKLAIDGGIAAGTALMYDSALPAAAHAYYYFQPAVLNRIVRLLHETGLQISFHIIGDKGIDQALDALEAAGAGVDTRRHRIEHALFVKPASLQRIKDLGVVISTQPQMISWFADGYREYTNEANMANFLPLKTLLDEGIPLAFGCDVPAAPLHDPKYAFLGATTRRTSTGYQPNPEQCLDIHQALRVHTMGSAYAAFEEDVKGSIEVGKLADLVVWNDDLYSISDPQRAMKLKALTTIVGGQVVASQAAHVTFVPVVSRK